MEARCDRPAVDRWGYYSYLAQTGCRSVDSRVSLAVLIKICRSAAPPFIARLKRRGAYWFRQHRDPPSLTVDASTGPIRRNPYRGRKLDLDGRRRRSRNRRHHRARAWPAWSTSNSQRSRIVAAAIQPGAGGRSFPQQAERSQQPSVQRDPQRERYLDVARRSASNGAGWSWRKATKASPVPRDPGPADPLPFPWSAATAPSVIPMEFVSSGQAEISKARLGISASKISLLSSKNSLFLE